MNNLESGPVTHNYTDGIRKYEESAKQVTTTGWACVHCGHFYGDNERAARYCCHNDAPCDCGGRKKRHQVACDSCFHMALVEHYNKMEQRVWDEKGMIVLHNSDTYFSDVDSLIEYCLEQKLKPSELFVVHCVENTPRNFDFNELVSDALPEDLEWPGDPKDVRELERQVDEYIDKFRPLSYYPDNKVRVAGSQLEEWDKMYDAASKEER